MAPSDAAGALQKPMPAHVDTSSPSLEMIMHRGPRPRADTSFLQDALAEERDRTSRPLE